MNRCLVNCQQMQEGFWRFARERYRPGHAERRSRAEDRQDVVAAERPAGIFSRQPILGGTLDTDAVTANYDASRLPASGAYCPGTGHPFCLTAHALT